MRTDIRYEIEHSIFPQKQCAGGGMMIMYLMDLPGKYMTELYSSYTEEKYNYSVLDFYEIHKVYDSEYRSLLIMQIIMPEAIQTGDCRFVYFCYGIPDGKDIYCCSALDEDGTFKLSPCIEDQVWKELGCLDTADDEFQLIANVYWELIFDDRRNGHKDLCAG